MTREQLDNVRLARAAAKRHGVPVKVFLAQIRQESGFHSHAVSKAGALGVAQIMPDTAAGWHVNPNDPAAALDTAAKHMAGYTRQYGSIRNALIAYNAGPGAIGKALPAETEHYLSIVLGHDHDSSSTSSTVPTRGHMEAGTATKITPGQTKVDENQAMVDALMSHGHGGSLLKRYFANIDSGQYTTETAPKVKAGSGPKYINGKPSTKTYTAGSAAGSHVLELIYNDGGKGFGIKNGQVVNGHQVFSDVWSGHANHVHVAAGRKTVVALGKLAQQMDLHVGENSHFGGVNPVHTEDSYHYKDEAIDVSGDGHKMRQFAKAVVDYNRTRRLPSL